MKQFFYLCILLFFTLYTHAQNTSYFEYVWQAEKAHQSAQYKQAAQLYEQAFELNEGKKRDLYLTGCAWAMAGKKKKAFHYLQLAVDAGFMRLSHLEQDENLIRLHKDKNWNKLIQKIEGKIALLDQDLREKLLMMMERDQRYRGIVQQLAQEHDWDSHQITSYWESQKALDSLNLIDLKKIFITYNYPGESLVGDLSGVGYFILQRADIATQHQYLPLLKMAANEGEISWSTLATFIDRLKVTEGMEQIFGTQVLRDNETGTYEFYPIHDVENVNQRRAEAELSPIEIEARRWNIQTF